ncbi:leucine-rich repeat-containing protein 41 [Pelodytes ibericus]
MSIFWRTQAKAKLVEDARGTPTLVHLSATTVSANMERLEQEVWGLPAMILQDILPVLNIFYLERIEEVAVKKGLSTDDIWNQLWKDIMINQPVTFKSGIGWRKKFLETFFHNVMRSTMDLETDWRLKDKRFCPLMLSAPYVSELTISNKQYGLAKLTPAVIDLLSQSVETLKFLHLRFPDPTTLRSLGALLHRLVHHGIVNKIALLSWPAPDRNLLCMILCISAGYWQDQSDSPCLLCSQNPHNASNDVAGDTRFGGDLAQTACTPGVSTMNSSLNTKEEVGHQSALLSLYPLNISQNVVTHCCQSKPCAKPYDQLLNTSGDSFYKSLLPLTASTSNQTFPHGLNIPVADFKSDPNDLYDFIFRVPQTRTTYKERSFGRSSYWSTVSRQENATSWEQELIKMPIIGSARNFRTISTLNLHSIPLGTTTCEYLSQLLRSWVSLERLTLAYNELLANFSLVSDALTALSCLPGCSLTALYMSDFTASCPMFQLADTMLATFPSLQVLSLCYDQEIHSGYDTSGESNIVKENHLKQLDLRFPQDPLHGEGMISLLKASASLSEFCLDNATFLNTDHLKGVLRILTERRTGMKKVSLHDTRLSDVRDEVVLFLEKSQIEEIKFSFCQLFDERSTEFFRKFVGALRKNPHVKSLNICGNRLGNDRLIMLADIYSPGSLCTIHTLDISSNCIRSEGLLQFASKLEKYGTITLKDLSVTQNTLKRDQTKSQEAVQRLKELCCVVYDYWDSERSYVDYATAM